MPIEQLEIDHELTDVERNLISNLNLESFDKDGDIDDMTEMQTALQETKIKVAGEDGGFNEFSLSEIATTFDKYVEKGEGWKLKIKEGLSDTPSRIKDIIENPYNNDLAYLVQKLAELIAYRTATMYTQNKVDLLAKEVVQDEIFGHQTKRTLSGLKNWIETAENTSNYTTIQNLNTLKDAGSLPEGIVYNEDTGDYEVADGYVRIDPYSSNYAVKKVDTGGVEIYPEPVEGKYYAEFVKNRIETKNPKIQIYGERYDLKITYDRESSSAGGYVYIDEIYDGLVFNIGKASTKIPLNELLDKDGTFDDLLREKSLLPKITNTLKENLTALNIAKTIRGKKFKKTDIFPEATDKVFREGKIAKYFDLFTNQEVLIDKGSQYTYADGGNIYIQLDNKASDKHFHKPKKNKDLIIKATELVDENGGLKEEKLKEKMKNIIENIIENHF
ncbi:MAG TPA: hypothetical protein PK674_00875 [Candidatus Absconditabacterales bacterium]|nr:hypothetical protein [Candidatus Absconditabacterales bacterium]HOQ78829.1 hypothetical protein [Candidatus Absconditabacterales bacterium]HPK27953.1 hypothetical protein [Candidatus Absconditabacterales bacterium]